MELNYDHISNKLKNLRAVKGINQDVICESLECTDRTYRKKENHPELFSLHELTLLASVLHTSILVILDIDVQQIINSQNSNSYNNNLKDINVLIDKLLSDKDNEISFLRSQLENK